MTRRLAIAIGALLIALAPGGCGGDDPPPAIAPGVLADAAPADADAYGEVVVRPSGDVLDAIDSLATDLGSESASEEREEALEGFLTTTAESLGIADGIDEEEDLKPWLGSRAAGFVQIADETTLSESRLPGGSFGPGAFRGAAIFAVTDAEAAAESLERFFGESEDKPSGVDFKTAAGESEVALAGERLIIGDEVSVDEALVALEGGSLADVDWLVQGVKAAAAEDSLGFAALEGQAFTGVSLISGGPRFAERYGEELSEDVLPFDAEAPFTLGLDLDENGLSFETGYGQREALPLTETRELVERLPANSWLAYADPLLSSTYLGSFQFGVEIGLGGESQAQVLRRLGYDPRESLERLSGTAALYARGEGVTALSGGLLMGVDSGPAGAFAVDAARFTVATLLPVTIDPEPLRFGGPFGFSASFQDLPLVLFATEVKDRLGVFLGEDDLAEAFTTSESLGDSGRLDEVDARLGEGWTALGFADLHRTFEAVALVDPSLGAAALATDVPVGTELIFGVKEEGDRVISRYVLAR